MTDDGKEEQISTKDTTAAVVKLTVEAFKHLPREQISFAFIAALVTLFSVSTGFAFLAAGHEAFGFALIVLGMIVILCALFLGYRVISKLIYVRADLVVLQNESRKSELQIQKIHSEQQLLIAQTQAKQLTGTSANKNLRVSWSRKVPGMLLPQDFAQLRTLLDNIQKESFLFLLNRCANLDVKRELIRTNIFLPDVQDAQKGDVCSLGMPRELRINMSGNPDETITFRPGVGATGRVFVESEPRIAFTEEEKDGSEHFDETWELTHIHKAMLHPDLRWVLSIPILTQQDGVPKAIGVLNIDGLKFKPSKDDLELLAAAVTDQVRELAITMEKLPMVRVLIALEDPVNG